MTTIPTPSTRTDDRAAAVDHTSASWPHRATVRHRAEVPLLVACGLVTAAGAAIAVAAMVTGAAVPPWAGLAAAGLLTPLVAAAGLIRLVHWRWIANGVEVTADQLPHLAGIHHDLARRLGVTPVPRLWVVNGNGQLNAFAAKCRVRRGYVVLFSDLVDLGQEHGDWTAIAFVLAHEMAHVRHGHVALWRTAITPLPRLIGLDRALSRAQEYTADRAAAVHVPGGARALTALYAGKRLSRHVDTDAHLAAIRDRPGGFWLTVANAMSRHPVGHRRLVALDDLDTHGLHRHGRIF